MGNDAETQSEVPPVSFEQLKTKLHFPRHRLFGFPNKNNAFSKPHSAEPDDGRLPDISSLKDTRLQEHKDADTTILSTGGIDISQCQEHAATPKSNVCMSPSEAKNPLEPRTLVDTEPSSEHVATNEPNANVATPPIKSKKAKVKYTPGDFTNRKPQPVMPPPDTAARAQKDTKSTEIMKPSPAKFPPDYVVESTTNHVRKAFSVAIARLRDDIDTAMESLWDDFEHSLKEIEEDARQRKKEVWNSGQRVNEWKTGGLEKQIRDLEEELKDTRDKLEVKIRELKEADEVLMSMD